MKSFIFSGLGADQRVFEQIDFGTYSPKFIPWKFVSKNETLSSYAIKMSEEFPENEPFLLIGISFGGILAQEVSKLYPQARILLLASVQYYYQLPLFMRLAGKLNLEKLIPIQLTLKLKRANYWFFGCKTDSEKEILNQVLKETDPIMARWAIGEIMRWKQEKTIDAPLIHIHGDSDKIFPIKKVSPDYVVKNGSHFMTVSQPMLLSRLIRTALIKLENVDLSF